MFLYPSVHVTLDKGTEIYGDVEYTGEGENQTLTIMLNGHCTQLCAHYRGGREGREIVPVLRVLERHHRVGDFQAVFSKTNSNFQIQQKAIWGDWK